MPLPSLTRRFVYKSNFSTTTNCQVERSRDSVFFSLCLNKYVEAIFCQVERSRNSVFFSLCLNKYVEAIFCQVERSRDLTSILKPLI